MTTHPTESAAAGFEPGQTPDPEFLAIAAVRGVGLLVGRTLGLQLLTAGVTVLLARLLTPADYGLFAIALAVQLVGQRAAELGLPAALVRLEQSPSVELQAAVWGVMLAMSLIFATLVFVFTFMIVPVTIGASKTLAVIAVSVSAMPFYAARATPMALLERQLKFGAVAIIETADTITFNAFALVAAIAGFGAFSLAGAVPAGAIAGVIAAWLIKPPASRPRMSLGPVRPLIAFGLKVTVMQGIYLLRDLGFVGILLAVGGAPVAGFYAMAKRLFSFPIALSSAVARVSYPTLSKDAGQRPPRASRIMAMTATAAGLPLALVAGAAQPLIVVLLGKIWLPTTDIVLIGSIGMMLAASAISTMVGYTMAEGEPTPAIFAGVAETALLWALAAALVGPLHESGVGIAIAFSNLVATIVLAIGVHPLLRRALIPVTRTTLIAAAATYLTQSLALGNDFVGLLFALTITSAAWLVLEAVFARPELSELVGFARPLLRKARGA